MDIKQNEGNQAAGSQEYSETPPEDCPNNDQITSLGNEMMEFLRQGETEKPNLCQNSEADEELNFLLSMKELIASQSKNIQLQKESESELVATLQVQVNLINQERDEMIEKYKSEAVKLSESKSIIRDLLKDKEDLSLQLRESQNEMLMVKAEHLRSNSDQECDEMMEKYKAEAVKLSESKSIIRDLLKDKEDLSLQLRESQNEMLTVKAEHLRSNSDQERDEMMEKYKSESVKLSESRSIIRDLINEEEDLSLQLRESRNETLTHLRSNGALEAEIESLNLTNENLISELNDVKNQLSLHEDPWPTERAGMDSRYQMMLDRRIMRMRAATQASQAIQEKKYQAALKRNSSLQAQLETACNERTLLEDSHQLLIDARQPLVNQIKHLIDERAALLEERNLLEDICLALKKKCRGIFGKRMQRSDFELARMKLKMRESQMLRRRL